MLQETTKEMVLWWLTPKAVSQKIYICRDYWFSHGTTHQRHKSTVEKNSRLDAN
jgi:hypothetical protein